VTRNDLIAQHRASIKALDEQLVADRRLAHEAARISCDTAGYRKKLEELRSAYVRTRMANAAEHRRLMAELPVVRFVRPPARERPAQWIW